MVKEDSEQNSINKDVKHTAIGEGTTFFVVTGAKGLAGQAVPTLMSTTGTVVAGVGTMHTALTAGVASFAATGVGQPIVAVGALLGWGIGRM